MAMPCATCGHPQRSEIEAGVVSGRSVREVARQYGLDRSALSRHVRNHLPGAIHAAAVAALAASDAGPEMAMPIAAPVEPTEGPLSIAGYPSNPQAVLPLRAWMLDETSAVHPVGILPAVAPPTVPGVAPAAPIVINAYVEAVALRDRAMSILAMAEAAGDSKTALAAIREARGVLEHLSRLEERHPAQAPTVPLANSSEWTRVRAALLTALAPYPEARIAAAEALASTGALS